MQKCVENDDNTFPVEVLFSKPIGVDHFGVQGKQAEVEYTDYHFLTLLEYFLFGLLASSIELMF